MCTSLARLPVKEQSRQFKIVTQHCSLATKQKVLVRAVVWSSRFGNPVSRHIRKCVLEECWARLSSRSVHFICAGWYWRCCQFYRRASGLLHVHFFRCLCSLGLEQSDLAYRTSFTHWRLCALVLFAAYASLKSCCKAKLRNSFLHMMCFLFDNCVR